MLFFEFQMDFNFFLYLYGKENVKVLPLPGAD